MANKIMTTIYLPSSQKSALARRAKRRKTTVSEEIRVALDKYLTDTNEESESQLNLLAAEASAAVDRMIHKLDEAHASFLKLRRTLAMRRS